MSSLHEYKKKKFQDYIKNYKDKERLDWSRLSRHHLIDSKFVKENHHFPWVFDNFYSNSNFTREELSELKNLTFEISWQFFDYQHHCYSSKNIVEDVENNYTFDWDWFAISMNENLTEDFIIKYSKQLNFYNLSSNPSVTIDFIINHSELEWSYYTICENKNMTPEYVVKLKNKILDWSLLTLNPSIPIDFILNTPHFPWDFENLSGRNDISLEIIEDNQYIYWDWTEIIPHNENIPIEFLKNVNKNMFPDNDKYFIKFNNKLSIDDLEWLDNEIVYSRFEGPISLFNGNCIIKDENDYQRFLKAIIKIQISFQTCYWFPQYKVCRDRLLREYNYYANGVFNGLA